MQRWSALWPTLCGGQRLPCGGPSSCLRSGRCLSPLCRTWKLTDLRLLRENETLPMWQQEFIRKPANMGAWFQDRGLAAVFAQVAAWSLEEFHRVVVLDADTLMLRNCDELFDLGRLSFAASPETHKDQEDITQSGGKLRTYLLNAGVMSIRPNAELLGQLRLSVQQPEFRWAVERIGVNGEPNFQALIDSFLQDRSLRHGLAVWSPRGGFEGCIHKVPATGSRNKDYNNNNFFKDSNSNSNNINNNNNNNNNNNRKASGDLASSWQLGGADHCLLPVDYNFFVDFPHVFFAAYTFRDEAFRGSAAHSASDAVWDSPRLAVFNATVRWLRNSGMLRGSPKILHWPGLARKPWQKWAAVSRSPWDEAWWNAHTAMC
ncbi:unnamed protein product, partial [Polarella glacialis]